VLDLELPAGWPDETVRYPAHEMQTFAFEEQPLAVYDGEVVIWAEVRVPTGAEAGTVPVRAALEYQACNDSQCLPPVTTEAKLTLNIGPNGSPIEKGAAEAAPPESPAPPQAGPGIAWIL